MEGPQKIRNRTAVCLVAQLCLTLYDPMDCNPSGSSVHGDSPGKNTGVGSHALLHGIFPTQESNPGLPHSEQILYCLSPPELTACLFDDGHSNRCEVIIHCGFLICIFLMISHAEHFLCFSSLDCFLSCI